MKILTGPTGSGKTALAFELSDLIFNADSYQFYREIPVLSNQPSDSSGRLRFVGHRTLAEPINSGDFSREALPHLNHGLWVGVGLYISAALYGLDEERKKGTPFQGEPRVPFRTIVLAPERSVLYGMLDERVNQMLKAGALSEAERVFSQIREGRVSDKNPILKAIGLKHLLQHLEGHMSFDETLLLWKRDTRRLAKRQMTWLRKFCPPSNPSILWCEPSSLNIKKLRDFLAPIA